MVRICTPVALMLLVSSWAFASTVRPLSLQELSQHADVVVVARVVHQEAQWQRRRIITTVTLAVEEDLAGGTKENQRIPVAVPGGEVGGLGQWVHGAPTFDVGERVVVFLERGNLGWVVVGLGQGKLHLEGDLATRPAGLGVPLTVPLEALRKTVERNRRR